LNQSPLAVFRSGITRNIGTTSSPTIAEWESPSNIALVKYWGKKQGQVPSNPSLSMTLRKALSRTSVEAATAIEGENRLTVNGDPGHLFVPKLQKLVKWLTSEIPVLERYSLQVKTTNTFPHSTGIASSASGISAFSLCLLSIISRISGRDIPEDEFMRIASFVSRMGSGSACRSVYGGFSQWGETPGLPDSSDLYSVAINDKVQADFMKLHDAILVVSSSRKSLSSTAGHELMNTHPYAGVHIDQARTNIQEMLGALQSGDVDKLAAISENEAMTLHSLIMTSTGGPILLEPNSLAILKRIQQVRQNGLPVFFTLDAGPNVHLLYPDNSRENIESFICEELTQFCENGQVIFDQCGDGPVQIKTEQD
jgi:diphosphomevalonate decarboxylase